MASQWERLAVLGRSFFGGVSVWCKGLGGRGTASLSLQEQGTRACRGLCVAALM